MWVEPSPARAAVEPLIPASLEGSDDHYNDALAGIGGGDMEEEDGQENTACPLGFREAFTGEDADVVSELMLCCAVLCCAVLCCAVLCCAASCST